MPIKNKNTGEIVQVKKIPFTPGWRVKKENWYFDPRAVPLPRSVSHGGAFVFNNEYVCSFDYKNRNVIRKSLNEIRDIILHKSGVQFEIINNNDIQTADVKYQINTGWDMPHYSRLINPTLNGGFFLVNVPDGKYYSPSTGRSYSSGVILLSTNLKSFDYVPIINFVGLKDAIISVVENEINVLYSRYTGLITNFHFSAINFSFGSVEEIRLTRAVIHPAGNYDRFILYCTVVFKAFDNSANREIESLAHIQFVAKLENDTFFLDSVIQVEEPFNNPYCQQAVNSTNYLIYTNGTSCIPNHATYPSLYIDNVFIGYVGFLSYDSNGNKYEIAPIKKYNNQNPLTSNVPLKEIWYGGGRVLLNTQTGYSLIYDIELNPFMIRKITSPLATSEQFDILPLSDCLLDSGGNCNAMPNEIPALQTLNLNDRNVIDRQGNIVFQIPLSDYDNSLAPTLTTWYSNGDAFVTFGNKTNRTVYITQDAGGSWDVCKLSEFTLTIV